jgi:hypothetical protein
MCDYQNLLFLLTAAAIDHYFQNMIICIIIIILNIYYDSFFTNTAVISCQCYSVFVKFVTQNMCLGTSHP